MKINFQNCIDNKGYKINGPLLIEPKIHIDNRGFFQESWNKKIFNDVLVEDNQKPVSFVQDNHSKSSIGTLRGLHFQKEPYAQDKLIRCISGKIFDVALDLRNNSETFLRYTAIILDSKNQLQFWVPKGFAHGFLSLEENSQVIYKTTNYWGKDFELAIRWNDPEININWPIELFKDELKISKKDSEAPYIKDLKEMDFF